MKIGYACLTVEVPNTTMKSCIMKNATEDRLKELIIHNLNSLENMILYNIQNNIKLFRISSDLIPFGSSEVNQVPWWELYQDKFNQIGKLIKDSQMRVSMHPGQYTVINSINDAVVSKAIEELNYHSKVLDALEMDTSHKLILHIGGVYGDKEAAIKRFIDNFNKIEVSVKKRIVIENDDKSYNICDVLNISKVLKVPVVFDNLHHELNPCPENKSEVYWINKCKKTWKKEDGLQKIHYSEQDPNKQAGSHSTTIDSDKFIAFVKRVKRDDIDIMLEVKDKNLSAVKCIIALENSKG